jgi:hypothetical protein
MIDEQPNTVVSVELTREEILAFGANLRFQEARLGWHPNDAVKDLLRVMLPAADRMLSAVQAQGAVDRLSTEKRSHCLCDKWTTGRKCPVCRQLDEATTHLRSVRKAKGASQ